MSRGIKQFHRYAQVTGEKAGEVEGAKVRVRHGGSDMTPSMRAVRDAEIVRLVASGLSPYKVAPMFGVSPACVYKRLNRCDPIKAAAHQSEIADRLSARLQRRFGCDPPAVQAIRERLPRYVEAYEQHRKNAAKRGIPWEFTLLTWADMWERSGMFERRGRGGACMARDHDCGPYAPWNVKIMSVAQNTADGHKWRRGHG